jgi:hypothetical protein
MGGTTSCREFTAGTLVLHGCPYLTAHGYIQNPGDALRVQLKLIGQLPEVQNQCQECSWWETAAGA